MRKFHEQFLVTVEDLPNERQLYFEHLIANNEQLEKNIGKLKGDKEISQEISNMLRLLRLESNVSALATIFVSDCREDENLQRLKVAILPVCKTYFINKERTKMFAYLDVSKRNVSKANKKKLEIKGIIFSYADSIDGILCRTIYIYHSKTPGAQ